MKITKVTYYDVCLKRNSKFLSKCSVVLEDSIVLHDIKILEGKKGRYILMPTKYKANYFNDNVNKSREDVFHPVNSQYFGYMCDTILKGFRIYEDKGIHVYIP